MSKNDSKKIIQLDVTDLFDALAKEANEQVRTIEEQCKFFIKQGLARSSAFDAVTTTVTWPWTGPGLAATATGNTSCEPAKQPLQNYSEPRK